MTTTSRRLSGMLKGIQYSKGGKKSPKSSTPGRSKGDNCKADWRKKYITCHPHAYRLSSEQYKRAGKSIGTKGYKG